MYCKRAVATFVCVAVTTEHNDCVVEHQTALVLVTEPHYFFVVFVSPYDAISCKLLLKLQYMMSVQLLQHRTLLLLLLLLHEQPLDVGGC